MSESPQHHHSEDIFENRKEFQLERMILFSDAVFAIVITLLAIDIKVPSATSLITGKQLGEEIFELLPRIIGFVVSFVMTGMFWTIHHRLFSYIINYDGRLIWLNLFMLFFTAFLPFSTSLVSEYGYLNLAFATYGFNLGLISLMSYVIWKTISNPKRNLIHVQQPRNEIEYGKSRSLAISLIFFIGGLITIPNIGFLNWTGRYFYFLIFPAITILKKKYKIQNKKSR